MAKSKMTSRDAADEIAKLRQWEAGAQRPRTRFSGHYTNPTSFKGDGSVERAERRAPTAESDSDRLVQRIKSDPQFAAKLKRLLDEG